MIEVRLECKNVNIEKIAEWLNKFEEPFEYKIWEYNGRIYLRLKVSTMLELKEITDKLREICEFRFLRVDYTLPWWKRWRKK
jgi:hypothetical protein